MKRSTLSCALVSFALLLSTTLLVGAAQATSYDAHAFSDAHHAVWVPGIDQRHLLFDSGATMVVESDTWTLSGDLTSASDGSKWQISVNFSGVLTGSEFSVLTGSDSARIKGATWPDQHADWAFAEHVSGTLAALDGDWAGHSFGIERHAGSHDYWAQFGTCMNDKNCDKGLSTWLTLSDKATGVDYRGDINLRVSEPVPEPSAALIFGLGTLLASSAIRHRNR